MAKETPRVAVATPQPRPIPADVLGLARDIYLRLVTSQATARTAEYLAGKAIEEAAAFYAAASKHERMT